MAVIVVARLWRALLELMERPFLLPDKLHCAQELKGRVLATTLCRQRVFSAVANYGDAAAIAEAEAELVDLRFGGILEDCFAAYGVPLDALAEAEAAIETLKMEEGEGFDWYMCGLLAFVDASVQTDAVEERLEACAVPKWFQMTVGKRILAGLCYFLWMTVGGGLLSRWLCKIGLNPYWPAMSFALSFIVWLAALTWKLGQWAWAVPILGGLIGWQFNHGKDIVKAMSDDAKELQGLLKPLFADTANLPAQLRQLIPALQSRGGAVLRQLEKALVTAKAKHHAFSQWGGLLVFFSQLLILAVTDLLQLFLWIAQLLIWAWRKLTSWATGRAAAGGEGAAAPQPPLPGVGGGNGGVGGAGAAAVEDA